MVVVFKDNFFAPPKFRDEFYDFLKKILLFYFSLLYKIPSYPKSVRIICLSCVTLIFWITILDLEPISNNFQIKCYLNYVPFLIVSPKGLTIKIKKKITPLYSDFSLSETPKKLFYLTPVLSPPKVFNSFYFASKAYSKSQSPNFFTSRKKSICKKNPFSPIFLLIF